MSSLTPVYIDTAKLSPAQLDVLGKAAYGKNRVDGFLPYLMGSWLDAVFLGLVLFLFGVWLRDARSTERRTNKVLMYWLMINTCCLSVACHGQVMYMFGSEFGLYRSVFSAKWYRWYSFISETGRSPGIAFFLHRAYIMIGRKKWILILIIPQLVAMVGCGTALVVVFTIPYKMPVRATIAATSAMQVLSETIITCVIARELYRSRTGWSRTDRMIRQLLFLLAETAAPPTLLSLLVLLVFALMPNSAIQASLMFHCKVHVLCVQMSLLSRVHIAQGTSRYGNTTASGSASAQRSRSKSLRTDTETGGAKAGISSTLSSSGNVYSHGRSQSHTHNIALEGPSSSSIERQSTRHQSAKTEEGALASPLPARDHSRIVAPAGKIRRESVAPPKIRGPSWWDREEGLMPSPVGDSGLHDAVSDKGGSRVRLVGEAS